MPRYRVNGALAHGDPIMVEDDEGYLVPKLDRNRQPMSRSREYHDGDYFDHEDPELLARLHRQGAISTEEEYAQAQYAAGNLKPLQDLAEERERAQALAHENAALKVERDGMASRLADLEAQLALAAETTAQPEPEPEGGDENSDENGDGGKRARSKGQ